MPKPGAPITEGSTVFAYTEIQQQAAKVAVPDVSGLSMAAAKSRIEQAGLNFEVTGAGLSASEGAYAARQSIAPGTMVAPATVISVEFAHKSTD